LRDLTLDEEANAEYVFCYESSISKKEDLERRRLELEKWLDGIKKDPESEVPPHICQKCIYDIMMLNEGKLAAQRFMKVSLLPDNAKGRS